MLTCFLNNESNSLAHRFEISTAIKSVRLKRDQVPKLRITKTRDNLKGEKQEVPELTGREVDDETEVKEFDDGFNGFKFKEYVGPLAKYTKFVYDDEASPTTVATKGWAPLPFTLNIDRKPNKKRERPVVASVKGVICTSTLPQGIVQMLKHFKCDGVKALDVRGGEW